MKHLIPGDLSLTRFISRLFSFSDFFDPVVVRRGNQFTAGPWAGFWAGPRIAVHRRLPGFCSAPEGHPHHVLLSASRSHGLCTQLCHFTANCANVPHARGTRLWILSPQEVCLLKTRFYTRITQVYCFKQSTDPVNNPACPAIRENEVPVIREKSGNFIFWKIPGKVREMFH